MIHYKIALCGLGSIARRHIRNLNTVLSKVGATFELDLYRSSNHCDLPDDIAQLVHQVYCLGDDLGNREYDAVFITNPTSVHCSTLVKFSNHSRAFFIEKPIFDTVEIDLEIFNLLRDAICYVACPLRYNAALQYVKQKVNYTKAIAVRAISSSYLPNWRPGQDYRTCYSAHRDLGGGVGIDLIHEWDYLTWLFGMPTDCYSIQEKRSDLDIDSDDLAIYIARNQQTSFEVHLDYFGRSSIRTCEIFLPDETIRCDLLKGRVDYLKAKRSILLESERNAYQVREIEHFFEIINHKITNDSTAEHAFQVLKLARGKQL